MHGIKRKNSTTARRVSCMLLTSLPSETAHTSPKNDPQPSETYPRAPGETDRGKGCRGETKSRSCGSPARDKAEKAPFESKKTQKNRPKNKETPTKGVDKPIVLYYYKKMPDYRKMG